MPNLLFTAMAGVAEVLSLLNEKALVNRVGHATLDRDPLLPRSQCVGRRLTNTMNRHIMIQRGQRYVYCCCMPSVRGVSRNPSKLGRRRNVDSRWAGNYRWRWLRR